MPVRVWYTTTDGGTVMFPVAGELTPVQSAFINASLAVGMSRLDSKTIDEFVRRIEQYQAYVQAFLYSQDGPLRLDRAMLLEMLGDYDSARTNATPVNKRDFDAAVKKEKAAFEESQALSLKKEAGNE